jgi:hypothetical protein
MKKPIKRIELNKAFSRISSKFRIRFSRTGGPSVALHPLKGLTFNTKHGMRVSKTFKGLTLGMQNKNSVVRGRWSSKNELFNLNLSKSGFSLSSKSRFGAYNFSNPNRSSFKFGGIQIRGEKAKDLALLGVIFNFLFIFIKSIPAIISFLLYLVKILIFMSTVIVKIVLFVLINIHNSVLFLLADIPMQLINLFSGKKRFNLEPYLSDELDGKEINDKDKLLIKEALSKYDKPINDISFFEKLIKNILFFLGWILSINGLSILLGSILIFLDILEFENKAILNTSIFILSQLIGVALLLLGYVLRIPNEKILEQKRLELMIREIS